jgi:hypothetical protein
MNGYVAGVAGDPGSDGYVARLASGLELHDLPTKTILARLSCVSMRRR